MWCIARSTVHLIDESDFTMQDWSDMINILTEQEALAKISAVEDNEIDILLDIMDADPNFDFELRGLMLI